MYLTSQPPIHDYTYLSIDNNVLINNGSWATIIYINYTLTPGPHPIELRFGQAAGGVGPVNAGWWTTSSMGFGWDRWGRKAPVLANYARLADPGDGSLLTTLDYPGQASKILDRSSMVEVNDGAMLDLGGTSQSLAGLSGSGTVSNGTLIVEGLLTPAFTNRVGTITLASETTLSGNLLVDVDIRGNDCVLVTGNLVIQAGATVTIANPAQLHSDRSYTVLAASGNGRISGAFSTLANVPDDRWRLAYSRDGRAVRLYCNHPGTKLLLR